MSKVQIIVNALMAQTSYAMENAFNPDVMRQMAKPLVMAKGGVPPEHEEDFDTILFDMVLPRMKTLFEEIITPDLIGEIYGPIIAEYSEEELDHIVALVQNPMFNRLSVDLQLKASGSPVMQEKMMAIGMRLVNMVEEVLTEFDTQEQAKAKAERAAPAGMLEA